MSIFGKGRSPKKEMQIEKQRITNAKADAKVEEQRAKTRIREKNGGAVIQVKFSKTTGDKLGRAGKEVKSMAAKTKLSKTQSKRARRQPRDERGRFAAEGRKHLRKVVRGSTTAPVGANVMEIPTETVTVNGQTYRIPVDGKGNVPKYALAARFTNVREGTGPNTGRRSIQIDQNSYAKTTLTGNLTPEEVKEWWARPNTSDIAGIDDPDSGMFELAALQSAGRKEAQGKVAVIGGTKKDQETIREVLNNSFTVREQKEMFKGGMTVEVVKLKDGVAGEYHGRKDGMSHHIRIDPRYIGDGDTLLHEAIHHARLTDPKRKETLTKSRSVHPERIAVDYKDVALEEAATVSETLARQRDYQQPSNGGYYSLVPKNGKDAKTMILEDRQLYAGSSETGSKGLRGQRAIASVERNFDESHIADLNLKGIGYPNVSARGRLVKIKKK